MTEYTKRFLSYHADNPHVWELFEKFTLQAIRSGRGSFSAKAVFERMRWHARFETTGDEFKINNNYTPDYARMFEEKHPQYKEFFSKRQRLANDTIEIDG